jgi:hypothetical protein
MGGSRSGPRRRQEGMAVIAVIALMSLVLVFVVGNLRALHSLSGELQLLEKQQKQRLQAATGGATVRTNSLLESEIRAAPKRPLTTDH